MVLVLVLLHVYEDVGAFLSRGGILLFKITLQQLRLLDLVDYQRGSQVLRPRRVLFNTHVAVMRVHKSMLQFFAFYPFKRSCELARVDRGIFEVVCQQI